MKVSAFSLRKLLLIFLFIFSFSINSVRCLESRQTKTYAWLKATYGEKINFSSFSKDTSIKKILATVFPRIFRIETGIANYEDMLLNKSSLFSTLREGDFDSQKNHVKLMQHALSCKGYYFGAISGKFDYETAISIKKLKRDALGVAVSEASVNLFWFDAILNDNTYICGKQGDENIRKIQQYINRKYSSHCGVVSCDGFYSKYTNKVLISALQYELGCEIDGVFGRSTTKKCPTLTPGMRGKLVYLLQCTLYMNGFKTKVDGNYSRKLSDAVKSFQRFVRLPVTGVADMPTIKATLVSSGDYLRPAIACDCATQLTITKAKALRYAGYKYVGRYLTGNLGKNFPKHLTRKECMAISKAGLRLFPIYQDGGHKVAHFCFKQGMEDARMAVDAAFSLGIPRGATIYFAVDCDPSDEQLSSFVIPYFKGISTVLKKTGAQYCAGVYGTRKTCYKISKAGYAKTSFVGGLSTHFNGNLGHPLPENWAFDQFHELKGIDKFRCTEGSFNLDKNAFSGRDHGVIMHGNV